MASLQIGQKYNMINLHAIMILQKHEKNRKIFACNILSSSLLLNFALEQIPLFVAIISKSFIIELYGEREGASLLFFSLQMKFLFQLHCTSLITSQFENSVQHE